MYQFTPLEEIGDNEGPERPTLEALRSVGLGPGYPYCAASVSWAQEVAADQVTSIRSALATDFLRDPRSVEARLVHRGRCVRPGSIVVWRRGNGMFGHAGLVLNHWCGPCGWTIEANTSPGRHAREEGYTREGWYVKRRCIEPSAYFRIVGFVPYWNE